MKYELKDRTFHMQLDSLSEGDFSKQLNAKMLEGATNDPFTVRFGKLVGSNLKRFEIAFQLEEILIHEEYNANQWNSYPDVTPPEGVLMRVETTTGSKFCGYYHTFAEGGCWCYQDGTVCPEATSKSVKRFRPWE